MLWTNSQCPPNCVHVIADVHTLDINSARGGWEQTSQNRSDKQSRFVVLIQFEKMYANNNTNFIFSPVILKLNNYSEPIIINPYFRPATYMVVVLPAPLCPRKEVICPS